MKRPPLRSRSVVRSNPRAGVVSTLALALALGATACGQEPPPDVSSVQSPIVGGSPDTSHGAVLALIDQMSMTNASACTGTTIALSGASGILLTAAHCVVANDGKGHVTTPIQVADPNALFVVPGPDWFTNVSNGLYYGVGDVVVHPKYDGTVDSPFDVAIVRFLGALPGDPVIPALSPTEDKLAPGTAITIVGFGKTLDNAMNTTRFEVDRVIQSITDSQFTYDQTDMKGACSGDSGGPALVSTPAGLRVAGITSFGDPDCTKVGASVRVSPVFTDFIQAFLSNCLPSTVSCDECSLATVAPGNTCVDQSVACATANTPCGQFLACADNCSPTSTTCVAQCRSTNPQGAAALQAIVSCQCNACTACATTKSCGGTGTASAGSTMRCSLAATSSTGTAGSGGTGAAGTSGGTAVPPTGGAGGMKLRSSGGCAVAPEAAAPGLAAALLALMFALARARSRVPARVRAERPRRG